MGILISKRGIKLRKYDIIAIVILIVIAVLGWILTPIYYSWLVATFGEDFANIILFWYLYLAG